MPTMQELADQKEARKLARYGLSKIVPGDPPSDEKPDTEPEDDAPPVNPLQAELDSLRQQFNAMQGRVAPMQQASEQYRTLYTTAAAEKEELARKLKEVQDQLNSKASSTAIEDLLSEDEKAEIDPGVLKIVAKVADALARKAMPNVDVRAEALRVMEEREAARVQRYRAEVMNDPVRGLSELAQLAYDKAFIDWSNEDDNDVDSVVNSLVNATTTEAIDRYAKIVAKRIKAFRERGKPTPTDPKVSLSQHMRRGDKAPLSKADVEARIREAKQLSRSRNAADRQRAQAILNEL